jgi:hypothetical protein
VQSTFSLPSVIDPPGGCSLCHLNAGGGGELQRFGKLLVMTYGLSPDPAVPHPESLRSALAGLEMGDPAIADQLRKGEDPHTVPASAGGGTLANIETPTYGCASAPGTPSPWGALVAAAFIGLAGSRSQVSLHGHAGVTAPGRSGWPAASTPPACPCSSRERFA